MKDYHINIFYSEEDGGYIADIPDLKYCSASGATPEEALREVLIAKEMWLESAQKHGIPIPKPRLLKHVIPISVNIFSGRVWVTLNDQRIIGLPLASFPWLEKATPEQQQHIKVSAISLYWPDLEDGIDMEYFTGVWSLSEDKK